MAVPVAAAAVRAMGAAAVRWAWMPTVAVVAAATAVHMTISLLVSLVDQSTAGGMAVSRKSRWCGTTVADVLRLCTFCGV